MSSCTRVRTCVVVSTCLPVPVSVVVLAPYLTCSTSVLSSVKCNFYVYLLLLHKVRHIHYHSTAPLVALCYEITSSSFPVLMIKLILHLIIALSLSLSPTASDRPLTHVVPRSQSQSGRERHLGGGSVNLGRPHHSAFMENSHGLQLQESVSKSSTLPGSRSKDPTSPSHLMAAAPPHRLGLPGYPYRPPSPEAGGKKTSQKRSLFRRRAESVDNYRVKS